MRASRTRPFDSRVGRTRARGGLSPHPGSAAGHLSGGLSPALATRLDPHDPTAELALHFPVQLNLGRVGPTTVTAVPISNGYLHEYSLSRRRPATGASRYRRGGTVGGIGRNESITRLHPDSEELPTTDVIAANVLQRGPCELLRRFWPRGTDSARSRTVTSSSTRRFSS